MSRLLIWLIRLLGPRYRLSPLVAAYLERSGRVGKTAQIPTELIPLAARLWTRGWFNRQVLDTLRAWILPYWAVRQLDPTDPGYIGRALQPVLINATYRTWTAVGNPQSKSEAVVDPRGLITPQPQSWGWSLDAWLGADGEMFFPSRMQNVTQSLHENLPMVQTSYEPNGLRIQQTSFAAQDEKGEDWVIAAYAVENPRGDPRAATLYLALRPFNPEGAAIVDEIKLRAGSGANELWVNDALGALLPPPDTFGMSNADAGDVSFQLAALNRATSSTDALGLATFAAAYECALTPHSQHVVTVAMPMQPTNAVSARAAQWTQPDALPALKRDFSERWRALVSQGMTIRVPDDTVQNAFDANKAHLLVLHDGDSITPGPFLYHEFWWRDATFMLHALDQLGYHTQVAETLKSFPRYAQKDGYVHSQEGEWDSNGQALWLLEQNARLSGDYTILHENYWQILNAAHWIDSARQQTKRTGERAPEHGLVPAGMSAEHLGPNDFYFWDNWWGLAGLRAAVYTARTFSATADAEKLQFAYDAFFRDLDDALMRTATKSNTAAMPASPYRRTDSAMVSNLIASYPLQLLSPQDPRILATIAELRQSAFVDGAFFHHVGHGGYGTYLALQLAGAELMTGTTEGKHAAWDALRFVLKHASPTWTWGETIHPLTKHGGHGDGHHGWAAAEVVSFIRTALLYEEGDHLMLTPALPDEWIYETASIKVERAATHFGDMGFTLAFGDHNATLVLKHKWRDPPPFVEWHLPMEIKNVGGDSGGVELTDAHRIRIPRNVTRVVATF